MSTREKLDSRVDRLSEKQLEALVAFLDTLFPEAAKQSDADEVDALCGIFHDAANPALVPLEKEAWAMAAVEEEMRFLEEMRNENS